MRKKANDAEGNVFLSGDAFEGIVVSNYSDNQYHFSIDNVTVDVTQRVSRPQSDRVCLGFLIQCLSPARFRIDVRIPDHCKNALVSLNDQKLIGYFSPEIPDDPEYYIESGCNDENVISTLKPGQFQSINFLWQSGDILKFFFYY